jgi:uncharacterized protein
MLRVVIDPGVLIAGVISSKGAPRELVRGWMAGEFELLVSPKLIAELARVLDRPKFRGYLTTADARSYVSLIWRFSTHGSDPAITSRISPDPGDEYLLAFAKQSSAHFLISGDPHLSSLKDTDPPVLTPRAFLNRLRREI